MAQDEDLDEWTESGRPLGCWLGTVIGLPVLAYHIVSLRWLRAPRWKNKVEARTELRRVVRDHEVYDHKFWAERVGRTKLFEFTTAAGTSYRGEVGPVWDGEPDGAIRVFFSLDDGGVGAFHPMTDSIIVDRPPAPPEPKGNAG